MPDVYWGKTDNRRELVRKILEILEPEINKAQTSLVKPNLVSSEPYPTTTHPEVLDAVLEFLSGKGVEGAGLAAVLLPPFLTDALLGWLLSAVAGIMIFIWLDELVPAARAFGEEHLAITGVISEMMVMAASLFILH